MSKVTLGAVGLGLVGVGSTLLSFPAQAAMSCGTAPAGGTLLATTDYCQLTFSTAGSYEVTVPSSATGLYAILVGAGSGVGDASFSNVGYAGSGGLVKYLDLTDQIGNEITVNVGSGGTVANNTSTNPGTDTALIYSSTGASAFTNTYQSDFNDSCNISGYSGGNSFIMFLGKDAKNSHRLTASSQDCTNKFGLGINPSAGDHDSSNNPVPAIFRNYDAWLGAGGQIAIDGTPTPGGFGAGGSFSVSSSDLSFSNVQAGHDGAAIFRWEQKTGLGNTGSDSASMSELAAGLMIAGLGVTLASRVRRRVSK